MDEPRFDVSQAIGIVLRRWWIFAIAILCAGVAAFVFNDGQVRQYEATASVLVQGRAQPGAMTVGDIQLSQEMARDLAGIVRTTPVLEAASIVLGGGTTADNLRGRIRVGSTRNILKITGIDPDPAEAVILANVTAETFILINRGQQLQEQRRQVEEIALVAAAFEDYDIELDSQFLAAQTTIFSTLQLIEAAVEPGSPSEPTVARDTLLAVVLAVIVASSVVALLELLDNRVSTYRRFRQSTDDLAIFAAVPRQRRKALDKLLLERDLSGSVPFQEALRSLVAGVRFASPDADGARTLLVASALPGEGKSAIATALAITHARAGQSVILVDANLRSPSVGQQFGAPDGPGLASVVSGESTVADALHATGVPGLSVLPAGAAPADPTALLASDRMRDVLRELAGQATYVVINSPAALPYADAAVLAGIADATVLVVDASSTNANDVRNAARTLAQANPAVMGGVLNKVGRPSGRYYGDGRRWLGLRA